ncbi:protein TolR [Pelagibius litoralis]|uniref:Protein TolR n=1 Tax=Pelagibius litoralis TaxID=374515 RepID=A0A967EZW1_9PROT|nr:protein TolR [Pelagibius litoralis]NIA70492.1 protein TolR [Pelagibius litoralis]
MAATLIQPRRGRGRGGPRYTPLSEINVTPFVDVMLVLLIVFMVTAPLLTVGVPVDLPKTQAQSIADPDEPLVISVNSEGTVYIQDSPVELGQLVPRLRAITESKPDTRIFVRGDRAIAYGRIMQVMGTVNAAGFRRVSLIAELPKGDEVPLPAGGGEAAPDGSQDSTGN